MACSTYYDSIPLEWLEPDTLMLVKFLQKDISSLRSCRTTSSWLFWWKVGFKAGKSLYQWEFLASFVFESYDAMSKVRVLTIDWRPYIWQLSTETFKTTNATGSFCDKSFWKWVEPRLKVTLPFFSPSGFYNIDQSQRFFQLCAFWQVGSCRLCFRRKSVSEKKRVGKSRNVFTRYNFS